MNSRKYFLECNLLLTKLTSIEAIKMRLGCNECGNGTLRKYPYPEFFWPVFSRIWTEYGWENKNQRTTNTDTYSAVIQYLKCKFQLHIMLGNMWIVFKFSKVYWDLRCGGVSSLRIGYENGFIATMFRVLIFRWKIQNCSEGINKMQTEFQHEMKWTVVLITAAFNSFMTGTVII